MKRLFEENFRALHEPHIEKLVSIAKKQSEIDKRDLKEWFIRRDEILRQEMESSHALGRFVGVLSEAFPNAKFILTIRDCYSWLRSNINLCINAPRREQKKTGWGFYTELRDINFGPPPKTYCEEEEPLAEHSLHSLRGYLKYWSKHNKHVLNAVPEERLLVVRTDKISQRIGSIANFLGVSTESLNIKNSHTHKAAEKHSVLDKIDRSYLDKIIYEECGELMSQYFSDIVAKRL